MIVIITTKEDDMSNNPMKNIYALDNLFFSLILENKWNTFFELIQNNFLDLNTRDCSGRNALFWAIEQNNYNVIEKLIQKGIDTHVTINLSAMNYAVYKDNVKLIKCLKNCGMDLDEIDDINSTPLIYAVLYDKSNSINYLIENGANIEHEDFLGNSAINLANNLKLNNLINKFKKYSKAS